MVGLSNSVVMITVQWSKLFWRWNVIFILGKVWGRFGHCYAVHECGFSHHSFNTNLQFQAKIKVWCELKNVLNCPFILSYIKHIHFQSDDHWSLHCVDFGPDEFLGVDWLWLLAAAFLQRDFGLCSFCHCLCSHHAVRGHWTGCYHGTAVHAGDSLYYISYLQLFLSIIVLAIIATIDLSRKIINVEFKLLCVRTFVVGIIIKFGSNEAVGSSQPLFAS